MGMLPPSIAYYIPSLAITGFLQLRRFAPLNLATVLNTYKVMADAFSAFRLMKCWLLDHLAQLSILTRPHSRDRIFG